MQFHTQFVNLHSIQEFTLPKRNRTISAVCCIATAVSWYLMYFVQHSGPGVNTLRKRLIRSGLLASMLAITRKWQLMNGPLNYNYNGSLNWRESLLIPPLITHWHTFSAKGHCWWWWITIVNILNTFFKIPCLWRRRTWWWWWWWWRWIWDKKTWKSNDEDDDDT